VLVNQVFGVPPGVAVGLILTSLMPGGTLSKVFTHLGRGNFALTICLTVMTTLAAILTVPLLLRWLALGSIPDPALLDRFQMPVGEVMQEIGLFLLVPMLAGMTVARLAFAWRFTFSLWCVRIGWVIVVVMVVSALGSGRIKPAEYGWKTPLAIIAFCLLCQQGSMFLFRLRRWPRPERLSIGIEATMRNMNLALLLKARLFPDATEPDPLAGGVLFVILFFAAVALCAGFPLAMNHRRLARRERNIACV
jgi:BASS family bile acid:Na+ symporter